MRGSYTAETFTEGWTALRRWLAAHADQWEVVGEPRYLGYDGPFVPPPLRYGEVQVAARERLPDSVS